MVQIRPATDDDIDPVCDLLVKHVDAATPREHFRRLFTYPWMKDKPDRGFVLTDEGRVVGYLGTVYADRMIRGRTERFCNLSSWGVLPEYRNHSLSLLYAAHRNKNQTFTNLSARPTVLKVHEALRYQLLGTYKLFTLPLAQLHSLFRFPWPGITLDTDEIGRRLNANDLQLLRDHQATDCGHLLAGDGARYCYVIWIQRVKRSVPFSEIMYVSDPALLRRHFEAIKLKILWHDRTMAVPLSQLVAVNPDESTAEAIGDWHYWVAQGYCF